MEAMVDFLIWIIAGTGNFVMSVLFGIKRYYKYREKKEEENMYNEWPEMRVVRDEEFE